MTEHHTDTGQAEHNPEQEPCPRGRYDTLHAAHAALLARRTRAAMAGNPVTVDRYPYQCRHCGGAHITRTRPTTMDTGSQEDTA